MGSVPNPENHIYLTLDNRLPIDKDIRDKEYSDYLRESAYIFKDGDDEFVDLFLAKVGINGNKWGLGLDGFEQAVDGAQGLKLIIDANKQVHDTNEDGTGKYPTDYILRKQEDLVGGTVTKVKKYDLDHDGYYDYARAVVHLDKNKNPKDGLTGVERFKNALAAGLNETSPTIDALDPTERWNNLNRVKFVNIVMVKNGAYKEYSKIHGLCKGSPMSCSNALAASLPEQKNDGSLMSVLGHNTRMGNDNVNDSSKPDNTGNTGLGTTTPVTNVFNIGQTDKADNVTKEGNDKPEQPELSASEKALQDQVSTLQKQLKESVSENVANIRNELAPIELFENEDKQKEAIKILGEDVEKLKYAKQVMSSLVPLMIAYYTKNTGKKEESAKDEKKDDKGNPLAANLTNPAFDNSPSTGNNDDVQAQLQKMLKTSNLNDLFKTNLKIMNRGNSD